MLRGDPAAVLGDADGDDLELRGIHGLHHGRGREQRDLMLSRASTEQHMLLYNSIKPASEMTDAADLAVIPPVFSSGNGDEAKHASRHTQ